MAYADKLTCENCDSAIVPDLGGSPAFCAPCWNRLGAQIIDLTRKLENVSENQRLLMEAKAELQAEIERLKDGLQEIVSAGFSSRTKDYLRLPRLAKRILDGGTSNHASELIQAHVQAHGATREKLKAAELQNEALQRIYKEMIEQFCRQQGSFNYWHGKLLDVLGKGTETRVCRCACHWRHDDSAKTCKCCPGPVDVEKRHDERGRLPDCKNCAHLESDHDIGCDLIGCECPGYKS